jgi:hypothetical protein
MMFTARARVSLVCMRLLVLSLASIMALPAAANMRAPFALDGSFSEHVRGASRTPAPN